MREVARWDAKMASVTGKATSISVEPRIWDYFCTIAPERGVTVGQLLAWSPLGAASAARAIFHRQSALSSGAGSEQSGKTHQQRSAPRSRPFLTLRQPGAFGNPRLYCLPRWCAPGT